MSRIVIRPATPADLPFVLRLVHELAAYEREPDAVVATEALLQANLFGPRPYAEALVALLDDTPVGFAIFFHNFSTWHGKPGLYLEDLYVTPSARGAGVGRALMVYLAKLATARECARFEWSVLDWNTTAIDFYRSLGAFGMNEWTVQRLDGAALQSLAAQPLERFGEP